MKRERRIVREDSVGIVDQVRTAFRSTESTASIEFGDQTLLFERVGETELVVRDPAGARGSRVVLGGAMRPAGYPEDLPYLADEVMMMSSHGVVRTAIWFTARDPLQLLAGIERECTEAAWHRQEDGFTPAEDVIRHVYRKGNLERYIITGPGLVTLAERPADRGGGG